MPTLDFKGKQFVYSHHLSVPFRELKVEVDKSLPGKGKQPSLDDNLIIHGDNLEALKALLPTHAGKIDCIFIDPPYNTGNEGWCYNDNVRSPLMLEWLKKSANPVDKEDLERHDKWLCMMWPRLNLLKELLSDEGFIFITIDDNEQSHLRNIMDEIFGEDSFLANIVWQKAYSPRMDAQGFSKDHDHILVYSKSMLKDAIKVIVTNDNFESEIIRYRSWRKEGSSSLRSDRQNLWYAIEAPDGSKIFPIKPNGTEGRWRGDHDYFLDLCQQNKVEWKKNETTWNVYIKQKVDSSKPRPPSTWWGSDYAGHNHDAAEQIKRILGAGVFQTPKPVELIRILLEFATDENSIVLDSFGGSGTTGHAVLEANKNDNGNRRFILIQLPEKISEDTPAFKAGFCDVCEITAERIRRVINGYSFTGTQRQELYSEKITWSNFTKNHQQILLQVEHFEKKTTESFDKIKKEIKDGLLTVTGERKITEEMPGLGGSFTFCTLGEPIAIESLLTGQGLPNFETLSRYVFYTTTGQSLEKVAESPIDGFIGETDLFRIHLFYKPEPTWLRSNESALNADRVEVVSKGNKHGKRAIVFAVAKFMSQKELTKKRIEFCQLPYAIHRILGA